MVFPIIGFTGLPVNFLLNQFFDIFDGYPDLHTTYLQHQAIHFGGLINSDPYLYIYTLYVHYNMYTIYVYIVCIYIYI